MGLEQRYDLFDLRLRFAPPVVPREFRHEITERTRFDGAIETHLDEAGVRHAAAALAAQGVEAVAICFLHSYANPAHEQRARAIVAAAAPGLHLSTSADIFPYMREFERWTTATVNAYTQPKFDAYLQRLELGLARMGFTGPLYLMSSSGGTVAAETARRYPVRMLESGPAAGVLMSALHGRRLGLENVLAFDLGGTTAKGALVRGGRPLKHSSMEVARIYHHKRGSGLALKLPVIDMTEIGAGGGSIAHIDRLGLLKVGPDSAESDPGPACYGRGGTRPTVTDADLVLGYLGADSFLRGRMSLDVEAARRAIADHVAKPLGLAIEEAAWGIHQVVNENMAAAARVHLLEHGRTPEQYSMVAFGGAGPTHAYGVARALRLPEIVVPWQAGVGSAFGMLCAPVAFEMAQSRTDALDAVDWSDVAQMLDHMVQLCRTHVVTAGIGTAATTAQRSADLRYRGQGHEIQIDLEGLDWQNIDWREVHRRFRAEYQRLNGAEGPDLPVDVITWRASVRGPIPDLPLIASNTVEVQAKSAKSRPVYFAEANGYVPARIVAASDLKPDQRIEGPAIVELGDASITVGPGATAWMGAEGLVHIELPQRPS
jgi:N-methylhydantoinase A